MRLLLQADSIVEGATGLQLLALPASPAAFARLLFGADLSDAGVALGRLAGIALLTIAVMAWPTRATANSQARNVWGLLTYNGLATIYLASLGIGGRMTGVLLWPAVAIHAIFAILFSLSLITPTSACESHRP